MGVKDRSFLELHGGKWRVVVPVPRRLQPSIGVTKLKQSLGTDSLAVANLTKWPVVAALRKQIAGASGGASSDGLMAEALAMRDAALRERRSGQDGRTTIYDIIDIRADSIRGEPIGESQFTGEPIFDAVREAAAGQFEAIALGRATPLMARVHEWHAQAVNRKERTRGDDLRALKYLQEWCAKNQTATTIESITRQQAGRFVADLPLMAASAVKAGGMRLSNKTANKYISSLSAYWRWLKTRGVAIDVVWADLSLPKERVEAEDRERPFSTDEIATLLAGKPRMPELQPLMRIAALSGARLDAIVSLRVKDCANGIFRFKRQKREQHDRLVPIHSALVALVEDLVAGKQPDEPIFPAFPVPPVGSQRERSMPASKAFTRYRKSVGVDDQRTGRKRGLVNFHSFRRWFITEAERAGIPESTIAAVVGHRRPGITFGLYSAGPAIEQFRACVEAVVLPASRLHR